MKHFSGWSRPNFVAFVVGVGLVLSVGGCAQQSNSSLPAGSAEAVPASENSIISSSALADALVNPGVLTVAIFDDSPPSAYYTENGRLVGWEVELANAIAQRNGLEAEFVGGSFDSVLNAVTEGTADIGIASMFDTMERQKRAAFVDYFVGGTSWASSVDSEIKSSNACGSRVGAVADSAQYSDYLVRVSSKCTREGLEPVTIVGYESISQAVTDIETGQLDALVADDPVVTYLASNSYGRIVLTDAAVEPQPYGIAVPVDNRAVRESVLAALQEMSSDQTYRNILGKWGVESGSINEFTINNTKATSTR
jgi:polar amino acid transport system substrate-binding protein